MTANGNGGSVGSVQPGDKRTHFLSRGAAVDNWAFARSTAASVVTAPVAAGIVVMLVSAAPSALIFPDTDAAPDASSGWPLVWQVRLGFVLITGAAVVTISLIVLACRRWERRRKNVR